MKLQEDGRQLLSESSTVYGQSEYIGIHALSEVVNSLLASGAASMGVEVRITYPPRADKSLIYLMKKMIKKECCKRGILLLKIQDFEIPLICVPSATVNGISMSSGQDARNLCTGHIYGDRKGRKGTIGEDIVLSKWVGMEGMLLAARERMDALTERFTPAFIRRILSYEKELFAGRELEIAKDMGATALRQITQGGIFAALWNLSKELGAGLELDMSRFSILQETVEVCEYFRLNPYQLTSAGSFLLVANDGEALSETLLREGIMASVIGRITDGQGKFIKNGEDVRCIDRPAPDEIWKLFTEK